MPKEVKKIFRQRRDTIVERGRFLWFSLSETLCRPFAVTVLLLVWTSILGAQEIVRSITPPLAMPAMESPLAALVAHSEVIFSGQVASIVLKSAEKWTTVRFNVETGIRGSAPGLFEANFVEGSPGGFPLRPGERVIVFLHSRNTAGITSFVANGCGLFERTGGDRVDLEQLQFCPALHHSSLASLPEPPALWPDPHNFLQEKSNFVSVSPIAGKAPLRPVLASTSLKSIASMYTRDFLRLLSAIASKQQLRDGVHPETGTSSKPVATGMQ